MANVITATKTTFLTVSHRTLPYAPASRYTYVTSAGQIRASWCYKTGQTGQAAGR